MYTYLHMIAAIAGQRKNDEVQLRDNETINDMTNAFEFGHMHMMVWSHIQVSRP